MGERLSDRFVLSFYHQLNIVIASSIRKHEIMLGLYSMINSTERTMLYI